MSAPDFPWRLLPVLLTLALAGCGEAKPVTEPAAHDHDDDHGHAAEGSTVEFKAGQGLLLPPETAAALGLETAAAAERTVVRRFEVTATVFDAGPPARASGLVPAAVADELEQQPPAEATLLAVRRDLAPALAQVEIILALPGSPAVGTAASLTLRGPARRGVTVPRAAVLRTATGTFVYAVHGSHLLRTPVRTGDSEGAYLEILDGLPAGAVVVTTAVDQLWLAELRLTKGGGHSH